MPFSIKLAVRHGLKHPVFTVLNVGGLALGLAAAFVLLAYVRQELSYDRYFKDHDRIYRIATDFFNMGGFAKSQQQLLDHLPQACPEIELVTRFDRGFEPTMVVADEHTYDESRYFFVDSTFFRMFSYRFLEGDPGRALRGPDEAVISDQTARKYFGSASAVVGRALLVGKDKRQYRVVGVVQTPRTKTHLSADLWFPLESNEPQANWSNVTLYNYVKLRPGATRASLERGLDYLLRHHAYPAAQSGLTYASWLSSSQAVVFDIQPLTDIYLHSDYRLEISPGGNPTRVYGLGMIGLFIILIAGANYVNLTTAYSSIRAREIGVKKTLGAGRKTLIRQFLAEAVLASLLAMALAAGMAVIMVDGFAHLTGIELLDHLFASTRDVAALAVFAICVGLCAGLYPATYLSRFRPAKTLKGEWTVTNSSRLRTVLVIMQFAMATGLGIGCLVIYDQLSYLRSTDKGFDSQGVLVIEHVDELGVSAEAFRQELIRHPAVQGSSFAERVPTADGITVYNYRTATMEEPIAIQTFPADEDFLPTLGLRLIAGRGFSDELASDSSAVILNEAAVRALGLGADPLGREINPGQRVIGVVRNFHFQSLRDAIEPAVLTYSRNGQRLVVRVDARSASDFRERLNEMWARFSPDSPLEYGFIDDNFASLAEDELVLSQAVLFFTVFAMLIACAGLFGLTAFAAQRRTKEIGIRKVFGATVTALVVLLSRDISRLVLVAFTLASPFAYLAMEHWLSGFAYRIGLSPAPFILVGAAMIAIALLTISYHTLRAATANPTKSLRYE